MLEAEAKSFTKEECCEGERERLVWVRDLATKGTTSADPELVSRNLGLIFYLFVMGDLEEEEWRKPVVEKSTVDPLVIDATRTFLKSIGDLAGEGAESADMDTVFRVTRQLGDIVHDGVAYKNDTCEAVAAAAVKDLAGCIDRFRHP